MSYRIKRFSSLSSGIKGAIKGGASGAFYGGMAGLSIPAISESTNKKFILGSLASGSIIGTGIGAYNGYKNGVRDYKLKNDPEYKKAQDAKLRKRPEFNKQNIQIYKRDPEYKNLPKEYWKLLEIELEAKNPGLGDGDEYFQMWVQKPWDIDLWVCDFEDSQCFPFLIHLGLQEYDQIGYWPRKKAWFSDYSDYDGLFEGETKINLKQLLVKGLKEDMKNWEGDVWSWGSGDSGKVLDYQKRLLKLIQTRL
jgi:hypothetical protein